MIFIRIDSEIRADYVSCGVIARNCLFTVILVRKLVSGESVGLVVMPACRRLRPGSPNLFSCCRAIFAVGRKRLHEASS